MFGEATEMDERRFVLQDLGMKRGILLIVSACLWAIELLIIWGIAEPWAESPKDASGELAWTANLSQTIVLLLIGLLLFRFIRRLKRQADRFKQWSERVAQGNAERGRFQVLDKSIGLRRVRSSEVFKKAYMLSVRNLATGEETEFRVWTPDAYERLNIGGVYEIEYIRDYPYVLRFS